MNNIPKSCLVKLIVENVDNTIIRCYFSIKEDTDLFSRLCSYSIAKLDEFIYKQDRQFIKLLENYSEEFPLRSAPTLYILNKSKWSDSKSIEEKSIYLSSKGRTEACEFSDTRAVRAVYTRQAIKHLKKQDVYELVLGYEKRVEIVECNPESENYAETHVEYSLENALVWYPASNSTYAIIACCDFSAVTSLITYLNLKYSIGASLPDLTETMLDNLAQGSQVRNATFALESYEIDKGIDVNTITIYDQRLSETKIYSQMRSQKGRTQRSGFYMNHPYLLRAGVGISCKYGRIWTPAHLDRNELINLAIGIITKLDAQPKHASENNLNDFFIYYSNKEAEINAVKIVGTTLKVFNRLIYYLALSEKNGNAEIEIDLDFQKQLAINYAKLKLVPYIVSNCPNCGEIQIQCPKCGKLLSFVHDNGKLTLMCKNCGNHFIGSDIKCDCGELCPIIDIYSDIEYLPTPDLMNAISKYADGLHPQITLPAIFKIKGNKLLSLERSRNLSARRVELFDLKFWKIRAHLDSINIITSCSEKYVRHATEKCNINNYHPHKKDCEECAKKHISKSDFELNTICLLRAFGIPIDIVFDGIHHGNEFADIIYTDEFDNKQHKIGIHVKKHVKNTPVKGLGRSEDKIKGLYAQVFYTLFKLQKCRDRIDTIGIAIPNRVSKDVLDSIQSIVLNMGYSFIALQLDDWEKISQAAIDNVEF